MSLRIRLGKLFILLAAWACIAACATSNVRPGGKNAPVAFTDTLVTTQWLSEHLDDPDLVVLDCTVLVQPDAAGNIQVVSGRPAYDKGHIPTAGFADLTGELADSGSALQFAVPTPEQFAAALAALGVSDNSRVVLYDDGRAVWAARVWWMLRWIGFDRAALLDGGLKNWSAEERPLSTETVNRAAGILSVALRPALIANQQEVRGSLNRGDVNLVDAMPPAHYRGDMVMYARPGHIPGASNLPASALLDESGHLLQRSALSALIAGDRDERTITYCGGGIAASLNAFALNRLGFTDVAVYTASLQEWTADPANPMEVAADGDATDE